MIDELRTERGVDLETFEIALEHLNQTSGGVFGCNVVDHKSKNNHQEPKSGANPNHVPSGKK
jgi:hypothetical protein